MGACCWRLTSSPGLTSLHFLFHRGPRGPAGFWLSKGDAGSVPSQAPGSYAACRSLASGEKDLGAAWPCPGMEQLQGESPGEWAWLHVPLPLALRPS